LLDILTMHLPINVKSPNNISKWQMEFNSAFKGLTRVHLCIEGGGGHLKVIVHKK
jgi:hypothetical protein